jgi:hypothetical protein
VKKDGEWIATFGPSMKVSKVNVEASPALGLVEVTTIGAGDQLTNIFYFDSVEAVHLLDAVRDAVDELEHQAVDQLTTAMDAPAPPRYEVAFVQGAAPRNGIWDSVAKVILGQQFAPTGYGLRQAEREVDRLNGEAAEAA